MLRKTMLVGVAALLLTATGCRFSNPKDVNAALRGSSPDSSRSPARFIPTFRTGFEFHDNLRADDQDFLVTVTRTREAKTLPRTKVDRSINRVVRATRGKFVIVYVPVTNNARQRDEWGGQILARLLDTAGRLHPVRRSLVQSDYGNLGTNIDYQDPLETRKGFIPFDVSSNVHPQS